MATGVVTDFRIYSEQINGTFFETYMQNVAVMNEASRGAISLNTEDGHTGYYRYESFFTEGPGVEERDPASVSALTDNNMATQQNIWVKLFRRKHQALTREQWLMIGQNPSRFEEIYGGQLATEVLKDQVDIGLSACSAALSGQANNCFDASDGTINTSDLVSGLALFGDRANDIVCWVMHSKPYYDLVANQITANVDGVSNFNVQTATPVTLNRPVLITDSASLTISATGTRYVTLGLTRDAIQMIQCTPYTASEERTGYANLISRLQTEYNYLLGVKGFQWDVTSGGTNPVAASVATAAYWDKVATDKKSLAGVRIRSQ